MAKSRLPIGGGFNERRRSYFRSWSSYSTDLVNYLNVGGYYKTSESRAQVCAPFVFLSECLNLDFFSSFRAFRGREREEEEMRRQASRAGSRGRGGEEEREIVAVPLLPASCEQGREIRTPPLCHCMHACTQRVTCFSRCPPSLSWVRTFAERDWPTLQPPMGTFFCRREEEM